ncbi:hypothetical protein K438DRAFT_1789710 [Mycena galopus ATCC 62051]|nr:hypothetical protein K438DRAFT_1789710 [Mycena galopus ATCC 62051]
MDIPQPSSFSGRGRRAIITSVPTQLNNITLELISGTAEDKSNNVVDIIASETCPVVNYSTLDGNQINYNFHPGTPAGPYYARMNGTIYNGNTSLNNTTSALSDTFNITPSDLLLCANGTWTPVSSLTDPAYKPLLLSVSQDGGIESPPVTVFAQAELSGLDAGIFYDLTNVDVLFELGTIGVDYNMTTEVLNTVTGFNAGAQTATIFDTVKYDTSNFTLDIGSFKASPDGLSLFSMRANITTNSPRNPGNLTLYSDEFFVAANASQPACEGNSTSNGNSASNGNSTSKGNSSAESSAPLRILQNWWICVFISLFISAASG